MKKKVNYRVRSPRELTASGNTQETLVADAAPGIGGEGIGLTTTGTNAEEPH